MKVLVTGASGFVGGHLVLRLLDEGHDVYTISRRQLDPSLSWAKQVKHNCVDVCNLEELRPVLQNKDVVFHLAGLISYRQSALAEQQAVNIEGTKNVMRAALENGVQRVVHTSSIAAMGVSEPGTIGDETISYNLQGKGLTYCDTKHGAEIAAMEYYRQGLPVLILNPGIILGENDSHPHHHVIFHTISSGWLLGCPSGGVMFSDINDVVDAHLSAMTKGRPGERYVIGNANLSYMDAARFFSTFFKSTPPRVILPDWLLFGGALVSEAVAHVLGVEPRFTQQMSWLCRQKIFFSWDKAEHELDYHATPFETTVCRVAPHYLKHT